MFNKTSKRGSGLLLLTFLFMFFASPSLADAATYTTQKVPSVPFSTWSNLGNVLIEIPTSSLKVGDSVRIEMPSGFKLIDTKEAVPRVSQNNYYFKGFSHGDFSVYAPESYDRRSNALYDAGGEGIEFKVELIDEDEIKISISDKLDVDNEDAAFLMIDLRDVFVKGPMSVSYEMDISAPPGSCFAVTTPKTILGITSVFEIGNPIYRVNDTIGSMGEVTPYIENGRAYIPLRYVGYALGIEDKNIRWDRDTATAYLVKDGMEVRVIVGTNKIVVNGNTTEIDVASHLRNDRVMIPLRFASQAFGAEVSWDEATQTITIVR